MAGVTGGPPHPGLSAPPAEVGTQTWELGPLSPWPRPAQCQGQVLGAGLGTAARGPHPTHGLSRAGDPPSPSQRTRPDAEPLLSTHQGAWSLKSGSGHVRVSAGGRGGDSRQIRALAKTPAQPFGHSSMARLTPCTPAPREQVGPSFCPPWDAGGTLSPLIGINSNEMDKAGPCSSRSPGQ